LDEILEMDDGLEAEHGVNLFGLENVQENKHQFWG
jgi:hypothetical protein